MKQIFKKVFLMPFAISILIFSCILQSSYDDSQWQYDGIPLTATRNNWATWIEPDAAEWAEWDRLIALPGFPTGKFTYGLKVNRRTGEMQKTINDCVILNDDVAGYESRWVEVGSVEEYLNLKKEVELHITRVTEFWKAVYVQKQKELQERERAKENLIK